MLDRATRGPPPDGGCCESSVSFFRLRTTNFLLMPPHRTTGKLPDISPASPGVTGSNLTMVSPGLSAGGMPPVSSTSEGQVRPYQLDDNTRSDPPPSAPTKVGKDGRPTHTVVGRNTTVPSPGRPPGSDGAFPPNHSSADLNTHCFVANGGPMKSPGGGEGKDSGKLKTEEKSTTGVPSSVFPGTLFRSRPN